MEDTAEDEKEKGERATGGGLGKDVRVEGLGNMNEAEGRAVTGKHRMIMMHHDDA